MLQLTNAIQNQYFYFFSWCYFFSAGYFGLEKLHERFYNECLPAS